MSGDGLSGTCMGTLHGLPHFYSPHKEPCRWAWLFPLSRWGNESLLRLSDFPKIIQWKNRNQIVGWKLRLFPDHNIKAPCFSISPCLILKAQTFPRFSPFFLSGISHLQIFTVVSWGIKEEIGHILFILAIPSAKDHQEYTCWVYYLLQQRRTHIMGAYGVCW